MAMASKISLLLALLALTITGLASPTRRTTYPDLLNAEATDLSSGLAAGHWSSVDLVHAYTHRIHEMQRLHAVTEVNPDAMAIARALDAERANGTVRGPLHGLPILVKGLIGTGDRLNTTAGSTALRGSKVPRDAFVVAKLRAAGAVILGNTALSEWANFRSSNGSNGWSALGGQVIGAYAKNQDPQGSSSGSAVASALGLAFASLGTDTTGSILGPAEKANSVGIKPTVGLTSRSVVIPFSEYHDTIGPIARTVADAAVVLSAMAGKDPADKQTLAQPFATPPDYTKALNASSLAGKRIGVPRNAIPVDSGASTLAFNRSLKTLEQAGATIVDADFSSYDAYYANNGYSLDQVIGASFVTKLPQYLSALIANPNNITDLESLRAFTESAPAERFPHYNTLVWEEALSLKAHNIKSAPNSPNFLGLLNKTRTWGGAGGVSGALAKYKLDAMVMPTTHAADYSTMGGLPAVTVPMGRYGNATQTSPSPNGELVEVAPNVPFGISFLGGKWEEEKLLGFAYAFEQKSKVRQAVKPLATPKTQLGDVVGKLCSC